jgi:ATP-dependent RNA helicase DDX3X
MEKNYFLTRYPKRKNIISLINDEAKNYINEYLLSINSENNNKINIKNLNKNNLILNIYDSKGNLIKENKYKKFKDIQNIPKILYDNLKLLNYKEMTNIQRLAIPNILKKYDLVGCAQTGSGKTLSYLLPIFIDLLNNQKEYFQISFEKKKKSYPFVLIIIPTRELAIQIYKEAMKILYKTNIVCTVVYGGDSVYEQSNKLLDGCDILIGTPGRLIQFLNEEIISFKTLKYLILDEADKMLDMGFEKDIDNIITKYDMNNNDDSIQTLMFSATFPKKILRMVNNYLKLNYLYITSGKKLGEEDSANSNIIQEFYYIENSDFNDKLFNFHHILQNIKGKVLVFVNTKNDTKELYYLLIKNNYKAAIIYGDLNMNQRLDALEQFIKGNINLLLATDVASRGLDLPNVDFVINFDMPQNIDIYIHRIGRTARCGKQGYAISLVMPEDWPIFNDLKNILIKNNQYIPDFLEEDYNYFV